MLWYACCNFNSSMCIGVSLPGWGLGAAATTTRAMPHFPHWVDYLCCLHSSPDSLWPIRRSLLSAAPPPPLMLPPSSGPLLKIGIAPSPSGCLPLVVSVRQSIYSCFVCLPVVCLPIIIILSFCQWSVYCLWCVSLAERKWLGFISQLCHTRLSGLLPGYSGWFTLFWFDIYLF
jgi:hypothetical protein